MAPFDDALCMFSATIDESNGSSTIEIPEHELDAGPLRAGDAYRVAVLPPVSGSDRSTSESGSTTVSPSQPQTTDGDPPVEAGDVLDLEIEDIGEKGDGIARVGPGYVIIVNDAALGDRVEAEITDVRDNLAFADVLNHYDRP